MSFVNAKEDERSGGGQGSQTKPGGQENPGGKDPATQNQGKPGGPSGRPNNTGEARRSDEEVPQGQERDAQERLAGTQGRDPREPDKRDPNSAGGAGGGSEQKREGGKGR